MRTYHTHFGIPLGIAPGWWDDRKRNHKPVLPIYLRLDISQIFPAISAVLFLAFAYLAIIFWSKECVIKGIKGLMSSGSRCDKCDWHSVQDEEHILLDCPHEHLVSLRTKHRHLVFPPQYEDSPTRLRTFFEPT
jgi:hypothetical protein